MAIKRSCFHSNPPFAQGDIRIRSHPRASGKTLLLVYGDVQSTEPAANFLMSSTDFGQTWSIPQVINMFDAPDGINGVMGRPVVDGNTIRADSDAWEVVGATGAVFSGGLDAPNGSRA